MLIAPAGWEPDAYEGLRKKVEGWIAEGDGDIVDFKELGERELAYEIDHSGRAYYMLWWFDANPDVPAQLKSKFGIAEDIIRHLITKREPLAINEITTRDDRDGKRI
jgi:ribosomal protein S6